MMPTISTGSAMRPARADGGESGDHAEHDGQLDLPAQSNEDACGTGDRATWGRRLVRVCVAFIPVQTFLRATSITFRKKFLELQ
jgi:hypothetical protein